MKLDDLKKMINESINEVDFEDNITMALDNIETWARNAKRQLANKRDPQIFYRLLKAIADKAMVLMQDPDIAERVNEDGASYSETEEVDKIKKIKDASELAWKEQDLVKVKNHLLHIHNLAEILIDMHSGMSEGYGSGLGDTKAAFKGARWTVRYPSDDDWKKHKKDLSPVYEGVKLSKHEQEELKLYKGMEMILKKLIKLHSKQDYNQKEEEKLQKGLKKSLKELEKIEKSDPNHE